MKLEVEWTGTTSLRDGTRENTRDGE
jgi:hypothetical protein